MGKLKDNSSIIALDHFIQATRDSGYKGNAFAVAELIDNALEADAKRVDINITKSVEGKFTFIISDNGCGMSPSILKQAMRFGGSTRFNSRVGIGRYGMGLPNSSLGRARRVDVYTWTNPSTVWWTYLDIDQIMKGRMRNVPTPQRVTLEEYREFKRSESGTIIVWSKCDRLDYKTEKKIAEKLKQTLGQLFRYQLWEGKKLRVNDEIVQPIDPLFLFEGNNPSGAEVYGPTLKFVIRLQNITGEKRQSTVRATFSILPVEQWHSYSNEFKRTSGISKGAGVSIVRAGREIDYGWFFMGKKRKENYDDWWRCELSFSPELDELFGVTNTKQGIHPTESIKRILTPDIEQIAHELNSQVRKRFLHAKLENRFSAGRTKAESRDHLLDPPSRIYESINDSSSPGLQSRLNSTRSKKHIVPGLTYRIEHKALDEESFFVPLISRNELIIILNKEHPFYDRVYVPIVKSTNLDARVISQNLELMLFAAARAECSLLEIDKQQVAQSLRESWSKAMAAFLE